MHSTDLHGKKYFQGSFVFKSLHFVSKKYVLKISVSRRFELSLSQPIPSLETSHKCLQKKTKDIKNTKINTKKYKDKYKNTSLKSCDFQDWSLSKLAHFGRISPRSWPQHFTKAADTVVQIDAHNFIGLKIYYFNYINHHRTLKTHLSWLS